MEGRKILRRQDHHVEEEDEEECKAASKEVVGKRFGPPFQLSCFAGTSAHGGATGNPVRM